MPIEPYLFYLQIYIRGLDMLNINYILGAIISFTSLTVQAEVNWKSLNLDNAIVEKKETAKNKLLLLLIQVVAIVDNLNNNYNLSVMSLFIGF